MHRPSLVPALRRAFLAASAALLLGVTASFCAAVVNISTSQRVKGTEGPGAVPMPELPEGSPFQDFFDDFFKDREGEGQGGAPRKVQSLGSGFVIDAEGHHRHQQSRHRRRRRDHDQLQRRHQAEGRTGRQGQKTDLAVLKVKPTRSR
jgi:serine protease Do